MGDGKKLKQMLEEKGYTVIRLARESGISPQTLYTIIKRDSHIRLEFALRIARVLELDPAMICSKFNISDAGMDSGIPTEKEHLAGCNRVLDIWDHERKSNQPLHTLTILGDEASLQRMASFLTCYYKLSEQRKSEVDQYVKERWLLQEE